MINLADHVDTVTAAWKTDDPEMTINTGSILDRLVAILARETGANINAYGTMMDADASEVVREILPDIDLLDLNY